MTIGIVTIIDNNNYGNRLQNYALQEVVKRLGYDVITFKNEIFLNEKKRWIYRKIKYWGYKGTYSLNKCRKENFQKFNEKIHFSHKYLNPFFESEECDYYIVGSDQVWNPNFGRLRDVDLLRFVKRNDKKISYAASFGISQLSNTLEESICDDLKSFKKISVREDTGKRIIKKITNRSDIEVVLDPTMLLERESWNSVEVQPYCKMPAKYILTYFLGQQEENVKQELKQVAEKNDCEIINLLDNESPFYALGPGEFLYLIKRAFLICTDSFHASVFSIIYDKPFVIFDRVQKNVVTMNSRMETLISNLKLTGRVYNGKYISEENLDHNYEMAYEIIKKERKKSITFLENALGKNQ